MTYGAAAGSPAAAPCTSGCAPLQLAALPLGQAAPDAEAFIVAERVLKAFVFHFTPRADPLRFARGSALLGEERLGICLRAQRAVLRRRLAAFGANTFP